MPKIDVPKMRVDTAAMHPMLGVPLDELYHNILGDNAGITQFGIFIEKLPPGSQYSVHNWHENEDAIIYMLSGEVVLLEDYETRLVADDVACWSVAVATGHHLENRSGLAASYLTVGTCSKQDIIHYPDHDLITHKDGDDRRYNHIDGRLFEKRSFK
jgi:uncharacterized cupin superfamily protein